MLGEMAEILLEEGFYEESIQKAHEGLECLRTYHADAIKFYCILYRAHFHIGPEIDSQRYFNMALSALKHHWGEYHPMHIWI